MAIQLAMDSGEMMTTSRTDQQIILRDGRILGYDEYGAAHGKPIIFMHGSPGSRLERDIKRLGRLINGRKD